MLVMLALRPQSAIHWPRELRLMLLMPVCTPGSAADARDVGQGVECFGRRRGG